MVGGLEDVRLLHPRACLNVANLNKDFLVGIKVRVGARASGSMGHAPLDIALEVEEEAELSVMCDLNWPPPTPTEVISRLREGDVLTHCFRPFPAARAIRRPDFGTLSPFSISDANIFSIEKGEFIFTDSLGHTRSGEKKFTLKGIVLVGEMWS